MVHQIGDNQKDIILNYVGLNYPECLYTYTDINIQDNLNLHNIK